MRLIKYFRTRKIIIPELLSIFLVSRLMILTVGYLSNLIIIRDNMSVVGSVLDIFFRWDSGWYMSIVERGYYYIYGEGSNVSFFPLYPLLVKISSSVLGNPKLMGYLISNIALFFAAVYLYKLVALDFKDSRISSKAAFYMLISPFSFFFSIFYVEGLFLFLIISAFYYARKRQWLAASVLGYFASLTRAPGILILIPLLVEYFDLNFKSFRIELKNVKRDMLYLLLVPAGLFTYMLYPHNKFGNAFAFLHSQSGWGRGAASIFATLISAFRYDSFYNIIFLGSAIFAFMLIIYLIRPQVRFSYIIYSAALLYANLSTGLLESVPRFISILFPIYLGMAIIVSRNKFMDNLFTVSSVMLLTLFTILFVNGYWFV